MAALVACGGGGGSSESVATVSGALIGANVPANTRVALVWKVGAAGGFAVGSDVPVVAGQFTMDLSAPPDAYFTLADEGSGGYGSTGYGTAGSSGADEGPSAVPPTPPSSDRSGGGGGAFASSNQLTPRDAVSGRIAQPLEVAVAGFLVYVDTNGNGTLDIDGPYATSTDDLIGGNKELILAYLRKAARSITRSSATARASPRVRGSTSCGKRAAGCRWTASTSRSPSMRGGRKITRRDPFTRTGGPLEPGPSPPRPRGSSASRSSPATPAGASTPRRSRSPRLRTLLRWRATVS